VKGEFVQATASDADDQADRTRIARNRRSFWWSSLWALAGLILFVGIFNFLLPDLGANLEEGGLIALGLIFSLVPAILWLVVFYRADSREPEPKHLVATVFVVGAILAAALYNPVAVGFFDLDSWLYRSLWSQLLGNVLVIGFLAMGIVYLAVRVAVFSNPEFDERIDGIIYAVAAGLGVATVVNFAYVVQHGGVDLGIGSIRMVTNALGYGVFAGVVGYFIGQVRFERTPAYYLPAGVATGAILTGLYLFLLDLTAYGQLGSSAWRDLLLAAFLALVTMAGLGWLIARANEETLRVSRLTDAGDAWEPIPAPAADAAIVEPASAGETPAADAAGKEGA
jgi:protease PrsW